MLKISKLEIVVERHVKNPTSWSHDGKTEKLQPHIEQGPAMEHGNLEDFLNILRGTSFKHAWLTMIIAIVIFVYRMLMLNYLTNPRMFFRKMFFFVHRSPEVNQLAHTDMAGGLKCANKDPPQIR